MDRMRSRMLMDGGDTCTQSQLFWPVQFGWFWYSRVMKGDPSTSQLSTQGFGQSLERGRDNRSQ